MGFLSAAFRITVGKLNSGIMVFVDFFFFLEICKQWLNANMGIVHNEISLNTIAREMWATAVQGCMMEVAWLHLDSVLCCNT